MAGPVKRKHQAPAHHISQGSVGLLPAPCKAKLPGKSTTGIQRILFDQRSDKIRILWAHSPSAIGDERVHGIMAIARQILERKCKSHTIITFFYCTARLFHKGATCPPAGLPFHIKS
jgi:hypothetical protein